MTTEKAPNYTDEMVATLIAGYDPEASQDVRTAQVAQLSEALNRTTRSVIAKLSRMGLYVPKEYTTKQGTKSVSKAAIVGGIAALCNVDEEIVESLEKATKNALTVIFNEISEAQNAALFADVDTEEVTD